MATAMPVGTTARPPAACSTTSVAATRSTPASPGLAYSGIGASGSSRRIGSSSTAPSVSKRRRWLTSWPLTPPPPHPPPHLRPLVDEPLTHLIRAADWHAALTAGCVDRAPEGFVHLSTSNQVAGTASRFYADCTDLQLLVV